MSEVKSIVIIICITVMMILTIDTYNGKDILDIVVENYSYSKSTKDVSGASDEHPNR